MAANSPQQKPNAHFAGDASATLDDVKARFAMRLPPAPAGKPAELADAWAAAVMQQAIDANLATTPPPTTLSGVRADLLMHICKELKRLITEREAEVVLRLSPTAARAVHRQMKAAYEDLLHDYVLNWAMEGAKLDKTGTYSGVKGDRVVLASKEALDTAIAELTRRGKAVARKRDEKDKTWLIYVEKGAMISQYMPSAKK